MMYRISRNDLCEGYRELFAEDYNSGVSKKAESRIDELLALHASGLLTKEELARGIAHVRDWEYANSI